MTATQEPKAIVFGFIQTSRWWTALDRCVADD
jgi:hypothetical protein